MADDHRVVYEAILEAHTKGEPAALATITATQGSVPRHAGSKMLVRVDGSSVGTVGGGGLEERVIQEALAATTDGKTRTLSYTLNDGDPGICGGTAHVFVEPIGIAPVLLVVGVGHVGKALAELGKWAGYRVVVCDDYAEFCNPESLPGMDGYVVCEPGEIAEHIAINLHTYVAAATRGQDVDVDLIPALLATDARYIGVIGSRRRWALTIEAIRGKGDLSDEDITRIHSPVGLELGAETPKEIALSILAEIVMVQHGGTGEAMKWSGDAAVVKS